MKIQAPTIEQNTDAWGRAIALRLDQDSPALSYDITERLRAARMQALSVRKHELSIAHASDLSLSAGQATLGWGAEGSSLWNRMASFLPFIALIAGLIAIQIIQSESNTIEIAEVDAALLLDELPPAAYTDPGFLQFLKVNQTQPQENR
jgi:hypothetical protein